MVSYSLSEGVKRFMPLYEYQCETCKKVHEFIQKFSDAPMTECPECKGPLHKLMSLNSFSLKGTGWYTTDYKRSGQKSES
jgi:putative FmdB family regulatory protein